MALVWNLFGLLGTVAWALDWIFAVVVYLVAPHRPQTRLLALMLLLDGFAVTGYTGIIYLFDRPADVYAIAMVNIFASIALAFVYLLFLSTLETPAVRHLKRASVRVLLGAATLALLALAAVAPQTFVPGVHPAYGGYAPYDIDPGPALSAILVIFGLVFLYGIYAALSLRRASEPGSLRRRQATAYVLAFCTRDALFFVVNILLLWRFSVNGGVYGRDPIDRFLLQVYGVAPILFVTFVTYGALKTHLFDIDVRIKWTLRRSVLVGTFALAFLLPAQIAGDFAGPYVGLAVGGAAAALLLPVRGRVQRFADGVAERAMPNVREGDPEYLIEQKRQVYRGVFEAAWTEGRLTARDMRLLTHLKGTLQLPDAEYGRIEREWAAASTPRSGALAVTALAPGAFVSGKYRVERELGEGAWGRVFLAQDLRMNRSVVLKALTGRDHAAAIREARAAAAIDHPGVVRIYDIEETGDEALLVMEYVDGGSLKDRIAAGGPLSDEAFARVADDLLAALDAVHAKGGVHRDVKPANVLLTRDGRAKLADFGIARMPGFESTLGAGAPGSVQYMAPEQARGKRVTARSDLHSAAATLLEARTGRAFVEPLAGESVTEMQMRVGEGRPFDADVEPRALYAWFARALAVEPEQRFQGAGEMRTALATALNARSPSV